LFLLLVTLLLFKIYFVTVTLSICYLVTIQDLLLRRYSAQITFTLLPLISLLCYHYHSRSSTFLLFTASYFLLLPHRSLSTINASWLSSSFTFKALLLLLLIYFYRYLLLPSVTFLVDILNSLLSQHFTFHCYLLFTVIHFLLLLQVTIYFYRNLLLPQVTVHLFNHWFINQICDNLIINRV
jgi:hypothetical protein